jgi:rSAM/selenodomain-associated transferase 1
VSRALVVAKAPVAGLVKTRLGAEIGMAAAAELAAASLLDTLAACREAFGADHCLLSLSGDLDDAVRGAEIADALTGWGIGAQRGGDLGERLANAHADVPPGGPVIQVGMDTPQLDARDLHEAATALARADAVLGPAEDGGWWVLGVTAPSDAQALRVVAMSTPTTYDDTRSALRAAGLRVAATRTLRDVDTVEDAEAVAALAPWSRFAHAWAGRS